MQVKCVLFPLNWVINKSYSFKSEWKETVEKKDLLGAEGGRPDLILSPTFSFSWRKPSIGDRLRPWWILFHFVLQHKSISTKTVYQMETFQSLSTEIKSENSSIRWRQGGGTEQQSFRNILQPSYTSYWTFDLFFFFSEPGPTPSPATNSRASL